MLRLKYVKTEYAVDPIGVETQTPRFSWEYGEEEGLLQESYRVLVASSPELLFEGKADKWDSGRVLSRECVNVAYAGGELKSCELCFVKVLTETTSGRCESGTHTFEMGLFEKDWKIAWRSCPRCPIRRLC